MDDMVNDNKIEEQLEIGAYLRSIRLKKALSENDIHKILKIKPRIITAIETHNYKLLPDTVTVTALVRQYALCLDLKNAHELSLAYKKKMQGTEQKIEVIFPDKLPSAFRPFKRAFFLTGFFVVFYFILNLLNNMDDILPNIMPVSDIIKTDKNNNVIDNNELNKNNVSQSNLESLSSNKKVFFKIIPIVHFDVLQEPTFMLKAKGGDSWIEIKKSTSKVLLYSGILKDGQVYNIPHNIKQLVLKAGNSDVLTIEKDGQLLDIIPKNSRVLRNFKIDTDFLLDFYHKKYQNVQSQ
jgi:cytoskeletal protein RodZ